MNERDDEIQFWCHSCKSLLDTKPRYYVLKKKRTKINWAWNFLVSTFLGVLLLAKLALIKVIMLECDIEKARHSRRVWLTHPTCVTSLHSHILKADRRNAAPQHRSIFLVPGVQLSHLRFCLDSSRIPSGRCYFLDTPTIPRSYPGFSTSCCCYISRSWHDGP